MNSLPPTSDGAEPSGSGRMAACITAFVLAVIALGSDRQPWVFALSLGVLGCWALRCRIEVEWPKRIVQTLWLVSLVPLLHLLPQSVLGASESWRMALENEWGIRLGFCLSPQWQVTVESWLGLLAVLGWGACAMSRDWDDRQRRQALHGLAAGMALLALLSLLEHRGWLSLPWWPRGLVGASAAQATGFGPFANPNHSSSLFALGVVLCCASALDAFQRRAWLGWGMIMGCALCLAAIMVNTSRAGLMLALLGLALWLGTVAIDAGRRVRWVVLLAVVLAALSVALLCGGDAGRRLLSAPLGEQLSRDLRLALMRECGHQVLEAPWLGSGLGQFAQVFNLRSQGGLSESRAIHPESDLLWGLHEGGLLLVLPLLGLLGWVLSCGEGWWQRSESRRRRRHSRNPRKVRRAFGLALLLALLHGLIDVPLHHFGYLLVVVWVAALSMRSHQRIGLGSASRRWWLRVVGVLMLAWSGGWLWSLLNHSPPPLASAALWSHQQAIEASKQGRPREAMRLVNRAIQSTPMEYRWYYLRAQLHLVMGHDPALAMEDFGRARSLEPHLALMCMDEGAFWLRFDPEFALVPWGEALRRYPAHSRWATLRFRQMMELSREHPDLREQLWSLAETLPCQLVYLQMLPSGPRWDVCLDQFLVKHPGLVDLSPAQVRLFLHVWEKRGDLRRCLQWIDEHPSIQPLAWPLLARARARDGDFASACELALSNFEVMQQSALSLAERSSLSLDALQRAVVLNPLDVRRVVELYRAQWAAEDWAGALRSVERAQALPEAPEYLKFARAAALIKLNRAREAWDFLSPLLDQGQHLSEDSPEDRDDSPTTLPLVRSPIVKTQRASKEPSKINGL